MHSTSDLYKQLLAGAHTVEHYLQINGINYRSANIVSIETEAALFGDEAPAVGNVISSTLTAEVVPLPDVDIPVKAEVRLYSRLNGAAGNSEWIQKGRFWIDSREITTTSTGELATIKFVAFDAILRLDVPYTRTEWNIKTTALLAEIVAQLGRSTVTALPAEYAVTAPDTEPTYRQMLGWLGAAYGGNWFMNDDGYLEMLVLGTPKGSASVVPAQLRIGMDAPSITQVTLHKMDGNKFVSGSDATRNLNVDCPWATEAMATAIRVAVRYKPYKTFEALSCISHPAIELGDSIGYGIIYSQHVNHCAGGMIADYSAPSEHEVDHDYPYKNTAARAAGGAGGAARKAEEAKQAVREAQAQLVADIGDVRSGVYAIASADDIEKWKKAKTTMLAAVTSDIGNVQAGVDTIATADERAGWQQAGTTMFARVDNALDGKAAIASLSLYSISGGGQTKTLAQLLADVITLQGDVKVIGRLYVDGDGIACTGHIAAASEIAGVGVRSYNGRFYTPSYTFQPVTIVDKNGTSHTVLGVS